MGGVFLEKKHGATLTIESDGDAKSLTLSWPTLHGNHAYNQRRVLRGCDAVSFTTYEPVDLRARVRLPLIVLQMHGMNDHVICELDGELDRELLRVLKEDPTLGELHQKSAPDAAHRFLLSVEAAWIRRRQKELTDLESRLESRERAIAPQEQTLKSEQERFAEYKMASLAAAEEAASARLASFQRERKNAMAAAAKRGGIMACAAVSADFERKRKEIAATGASAAKSARFNGVAVGTQTAANQVTVGTQTADDEAAPQRQAAISAAAGASVAGTGVSAAAKRPAAQRPVLEPLSRLRIPELGRKALRAYLHSMGASQNGEPAELKDRLVRLFAANGIDQGNDDGTTAKWYHPGVTLVRITKVPKSDA